MNNWFNRSQVSPARKGADLIVGIAVFILVIWFLRSERWEQATTSFAAFFSQDFGNAVEDARTLRLQSLAINESGSIDTAPLKFGGPLSSLMRMFASAFETFLPVAINVLSAIGSAAISVFLLSKTFVMGVVESWYSGAGEALVRPTGSVEELRELSDQRYAKLKSANKLVLAKTEENAKAIQAVDVSIDEGKLRELLDSMKADIEKLQESPTEANEPSSETRELLKQISETMAVVAEQTRKTPRKRTTRKTSEPKS